ncbi:MAG TPA: family 78 glycoside hydrolase catalytic domain, partial [Sedimentisphaerales bacterium]|nr:family 78 glycoside hydrolase catalytic domain [Sedimentisphaerales bacterium]
QPRLSWTLASDKRNQMQSAYQIIVASSEEKLNKNIGDVWDSGKVISDINCNITYQGQTLSSDTKYFWKIKVWDADGGESQWSKPVCWSMGLLNDSEKTAKWIGYDKGLDPAPDPLDSHFKSSLWIWSTKEPKKAENPAKKRYFRKDIILPADRNIKDAIIAITADHSFELFVNGEKVGEMERVRLPQRYDLSTLLKAGKNNIAVIGEDQPSNGQFSGLIAAILINFDNGEPMVVKTDESWVISEDCPDGWQTTEIEKLNFKNVEIVSKYGEKWDWMPSGNLQLPPAKYLRKSFTLSKPITKATVYSSALGLYELHINGQKVGDDLLTPGWTAYDIRTYYNTYDVTSIVKKGDNAVGAILADGWYAGYVGGGMTRELYGRYPRFFSQLHVTYTDGTKEIIKTDETWKAINNGPIFEADFLMGQGYDATKEIPGWDKPDFNESNWDKPNVTDSVKCKLRAHPSYAVKEIAKIKPVEITEPAKDVYVINTGQNLAGVARVKFNEPKATKIRLRFAERLKPDGNIYVTNLRGARAYDTYICKGQANEVFQPQFTFHGFQYIEITGVNKKPSLDDVATIAFSSAIPRAGYFQCSDETANKLYSNICWTQWSNFIDIPTDCPQRDERLGWLGDAQIYIRTASYNNDVSAFYTKWIVDLFDAQLENGDMINIAPRRGDTNGNAAGWGDAATVCPWTIYQVYGDKKILEEHYEGMVKWVEFCLANSKDFIRPKFGFGDWLSVNAWTAQDVLATQYFAYSTKILAKTAKILGKEQDYEKYNQLFENIKAAFNKAFVEPDGKVVNYTQTAYVLSIAFGLLDEEKTKLAAEHLVADIEKMNYHLTSGFLGTKDLMTTLTAIGRADIAYKLFHQDSYPGWNFSIKHGATSIWERWDGWTPENGFADAGMNSFAHYSFGAVAEWIFKTVGGIDTDGAGFKKIIIKPQPGGKLTWAKTSYNSINGLIATDWKINDGVFILDVTIPANTTATICIPTTDPQSVKMDGKKIDFKCENGFA